MRTYKIRRLWGDAWEVVRASSRTAALKSLGVGTYEVKGTHLVQTFNVDRVSDTTLICYWRQSPIIIDGDRKVV